MAQKFGSLGGCQQRPGLPPTTYAWALSALTLGIVYIALFSLLSVALILSIYGIALLTLTLPMLTLAVGFVNAGSGILNGRMAACRSLNTCAGFAILSHFLVLCVIGVLFNNISLAALDYRAVIGLLVFTAQLTYCGGLFYHMLRQDAGPKTVGNVPYLSLATWMLIAVGAVLIGGCLILVRVMGTFAAPSGNADSGPQPSRRQTRTRLQLTVSASRQQPQRSDPVIQQQRSLPFAEQMRNATRETERAAPALLGDWMYPGARVIPFELRSGSIAFPTMALETTDTLQAVVNFYDRLATNGHRTEKGYILEGQRPGDGQPTEIWIGTSRDRVFIRFDARRVAPGKYP